MQRRAFSLVVASEETSISQGDDVPSKVAKASVQLGFRNVDKIQAIRVTSFSR